MEDNSEVVSFGDLFEFIRRGLLLSLAVAVVAATAAYLFSRTTEPSYRARATVLASQVNPELRSFGVSLVTAPSLDVAAYRAAVVSDPLLLSAMAGSEITDTSQSALRDFRDSLSVRTEETRSSSLIHIDAESPSPEAAAQRANAVTAALLAWDVNRASQNLSRIITALEGQIGSLDAQIETLSGSEGSQEQQDQLSGLTTLRAQQQTQLNSARALSNSAVGLLEVIQPAPAPLVPVSPRPLLNAALAFVLGMFLSYGLLLLKDALNTRLRSVEDLAKVSGLAVLAEFPKQAPGMRRLPREASSYLRTNVLFATADAQPKIILVTSAQAGEGKTSTALSLAESFARNDHKTLVIDADMRKPTLGSEYKLNRKEHPPLRAYLENLHQDYLPAQLGSVAENLYVIPSYEAAPSPSELLHHGFRARLDEWRQDYDVIIIDSPPVLPVTDALILAPFCTGTLLAASPQRSDRRQVEAAVATLTRVGVRMLGVVATNLVYSKKGGKAHGYGYGYGEKEEATPSLQPVKTSKPAQKVMASASLHKSEPSD